MVRILLTLVLDKYLMKTKLNSSSKTISTQIQIVPQVFLMWYPSKRTTRPLHAMSFAILGSYQVLDLAHRVIFLVRPKKNWVTE